MGQEPSPWRQVTGVHPLLQRLRAPGGSGRGSPSCCSGADTLLYRPLTADAAQPAHHLSTTATGRSARGLTSFSHGGPLLQPETKAFPQTRSNSCKATEHQSSSAGPMAPSCGRSGSRPAGLVLLSSCSRSFSGESCSQSSTVLVGTRASSSTSPVAAGVGQAGSSRLPVLALKPDPQLNWEE